MGRKNKRRGRKKQKTAVRHESDPPVLKVDALAPFVSRGSWNGDKWDGGFGLTQIFEPDYWTLRARSAQLFQSNIYGRGIIRRYVRNIINTGLNLEALPVERLLDDRSLDDWAEEIETRFELWGKDPQLCDTEGRRTFGAIQADAKREALVEGDVLILNRYSKDGLSTKVVRGSRVQTPLKAKPRAGNKIQHGVELDPSGRHVAFWVRQDDGTHKRVPAWGERSGRRLAWLYYGTDNRIDQVRGQPLLGLVLQSLREIDRYRDSTQRKAVVTSLLALFIKKTEPKPGTRPLAAGAVRRGTDITTDTQGTARSFSTAEMHPGMAYDELEQGEEPVVFKTDGTTESFGNFEDAIVQAMAWHLEAPPEILKLSFNSNYSASQAANNEWKMFLDAERSRFGDGFCQPIYQEWLVSEALQQRIESRELLDVWRGDRVLFGAWTFSDWSGHVKPSVDPVKQTKAYKLQLEEGLITRDRAARESNGTKWRRNIVRLRQENELLAWALEPLATLNQTQADAIPDEPTNEPEEEENASSASSKGVLHVVT